MEIVPLFKENIKMLRSMIATNIEIVPEITTSFARVLVDPTHICQVLLNLCTNAEHAMRPGGGVLTVGLSDIHTEGSPDLVPGRYLCLVVQDTGAGIGPEIRERIFDPFFTTKGPGEGTGMGLSVVHGIVTGYGGTIRVESEEGRGTRFEVLLPMAEIDVGPDIAEHAEIPGGREHILLVDDEQELLSVGSELLSGLGYRVTGMSCPRRALEFFRDHAPGIDLVITDMTMPGMLGTDLVRDLREVRMDTPVILCTGCNRLATPEKLRELGIDELLLKPVGRRDLAESVRSVLDRKV